MWKYFLRLPQIEKVRCLVCRLLLSFGPRSTSANLMKHLQRRHADICAAVVLEKCEMFKSRTKFLETFGNMYDQC